MLHQQWQGEGGSLTGSQQWQGEGGMLTWSHVLSRETSPRRPHTASYLPPPLPSSPPPPPLLSQGPGRGGGRSSRGRCSSGSVRVLGVEGALEGYSWQGAAPNLELPQSHRKWRRVQISTTCSEKKEEEEKE